MQKGAITICTHSQGTIHHIVTPSAYFVLFRGLPGLAEVYSPKRNNLGKGVMISSIRNTVSLPCAYSPCQHCLTGYHNTHSNFIRLSSGNYRTPLPAF